MSSRPRPSPLHAALVSLAWCGGIVLALVGIALCGPLVLLVGAVAGVVTAALGWAKGKGGRERVLARAATVAVGALAAAGLVAAVGPVAAPIGLAAVAFVVARNGRRGRRAEVVSGDLVALTGAELARDWRISYMRLAQAMDAETLAQVVELRRRQLDEIERRDPDGYRRWVSSGNWVRGDSVPFLRG